MFAEMQSLLIWDVTGTAFLGQLALFDPSLPPRFSLTYIVLYCQLFSYPEYSRTEIKILL
jgi:hypothetical protein